MVKRLYFFLIIGWLYWNHATAAQIDVSAEIQQDSAYQNQPLKGIITITHPKDLQINATSFLIGNEKLNSDFIKDVRIDPNDPTVLSIYHFQLPGKDKGLYALPQISVEIGGKTYRSIMSSYTVMPNPEASEETAAPLSNQSTTAPASPSKANAQLNLEAGVIGPPAIYPGQNVTVYYRYTFTGNIGLTTENVPLLDANGFVKIGEKEIKDYTKGDASIREISQVIQAVKPGKYTFGPSLIEGFAYKNDSFGHPLYASKKLSSEASTVELTVLPFPENSKPPSFNGAVGKFTFRTELLSSDAVDVGDSLNLGLIISRKGDVKDVPIPDLCCQPGFSGFFKQSDLPAKESIDGNTKTASVELRILTDKIKEIPPVEFSYFDPEIAKYIRLKSNPIPIKVQPRPSPPKQSLSKNPPEPPTAEQTFTVTPIEIETIMPLSAADLHNLPFGTWWALAIIPVGIALIAFQYHLKTYMDWKRNLIVPISSQELFSKAFLDPTKCHFDTLKGAFEKALDERHINPQGPLHQETIAFLTSLEERRFSKNGHIDIPEIKAQAKALLKKIQSYKSQDA